jgi:putative endopeptidase
MVQKTQRVIEKKRKRKTRKKECNSYIPYVPSNSKTIKPGSNFYKYINNKWIDSARIEPFKSSNGVSQEIQNNIDNILLKKIYEFRTNVLKNDIDNMTHDEIAIGRFAESILRDKYQNNNILILKDILQNINCIRDENDIATTLGELCHTRISNILNIYAGPEERSSNHWRLHISPGTLGLPHSAYYKKQAPSGNRAFMIYTNILKETGDILDIDNLDEFATIEAGYADYLDTAYYDEQRILKGTILESTFKYIPWGKFWETYGLKGSQWKGMKFAIDSVSWLHHLNWMFRELKLSQWKKIFQGSIIVNFLEVLPPPFDNMHFKLYSHFLKGEKRKTPQEKFMLNTIKLWLTVSVSRIYMKYNMSIELKKDIHKFTKTIFKAAENRIKVSWLEKSTKKEGIRKIRKIKAAVMYPDTKFNYHVPDLVSDNLIKNIINLGISRSQQEVRDVQEKYASQTWENPVFMVNAFYLSAGNRLVLPAGIVQWPFYCKQVSLGWNYGGLGAVIGHELTHAFDTDGKEYDSNGNKRDWWSTNDDRKYNKKARAIISMFSKAKVHGKYLDAANTLMENIADLGGMAITLDALKYEMNKQHLSEEEQLQQFRNFFKSFAVSWREKNRKEIEIQQLLIDSHSPPELRVNLIVPHFEEWYKSYNIQPSDKMYIPPEKRITIF